MSICVNEYEYASAARIEYKEKGEIVRTETIRFLLIIVKKWEFF